MCQVEEEDLEAIVAHDVANEEKSWICVRCGSAAVIHLRDADAKCQSCFITSVIQKFRSTLAKYQVSRRKDSILLAFSGGASSSTLLHLVQEGMKAEHCSRLAFTPLVLYIDEGVDKNFSDERRTEDLRSVKNLVMKMGDWKFLHSSLEMIFSPDFLNLAQLSDQNDVPLVHTSAEYSDKLKNLLKSTNSPTAKEELLKLMRSALLRNIGHQLKTPMIFVGDTLDRLAVQLITNTALGKGRHLPLDLGFLDSRDGECQVFRPLKEITLKEICAYNQLCQVDFMGASLNGSTNAAGNADSVYRMSKKFVFDLQVGFPQTVTTLCKTADKLCATSKSYRNGSISAVNSGICGLCSGPLDEMEKGSCSAENSIWLSSKLSAASPQPVDLEDFADKSCRSSTLSSETEKDCESGGLEERGCGSSVNGKCCSSRGKTQQPLCYSCRWLLSEIADKKLLPVGLGMAWEEKQKKQRQQQVRESIKEFLLDEIDDVDERN